MNAYTEVIETEDSTKSNSSGVVEENNYVANFATGGNFNSLENNQSQIHSNGSVMNEHDQAGRKKADQSMTNQDVMFLTQLSIL